MSIHQRTSLQHKKRLTNMGNCRNKRLYYVYITVIILMLGLSATAKRSSKSKYETYQIHEATVDSTMYDLLLHKAIPALEAHHINQPFSWMVFSNKSAYARDTTANLVGAVWSIECEETENVALYYMMPKFFCKVGTKIVFLENHFQILKWKKMGVLLFSDISKIILFVGHTILMREKSFGRKMGTRLGSLMVMKSKRRKFKHNTQIL